VERPKEHTFAGDGDRQADWTGQRPVDPSAPPPAHAQPGGRHPQPSASAGPYPSYSPAGSVPPGVAPPGYAPYYPPPAYPQPDYTSPVYPYPSPGYPPPGYAPPGYEVPVRGYGGALPRPWPPTAAPSASSAPAPDSPPASAQRGTSRGAATGLATGSALAALLAKFGILLKLLLPLASAIVSFGAYALLFGWQFAAGILLLLFIHEMGHYVVIRAKGLPAGLPVFIPLLGAYVAMRKMPLNVRDEAEIAIAGPLAGALAGMACVALYEQTDLRLLLVLAYFNFFINLVNLIPVSPLDGGRIVGAISRWFWPLGLIALVAGFIYTQSLLLLILAWLGFGQTVSRFRSAGHASYYQMSWLSRAYVTLAYFGLAAGLALGMFGAQHALGMFGGGFFG
jgi:Zn-dependent protease